MKLLPGLCGVLLCLCSGTAAAYRIDIVARELDHPWSLAFLPDGRALLSERVGRVRIIADGALQAGSVDGVPTVFSSGQAGLFDLLVDPDFARNGYVYLSYAEGDDDANRLRVVRARLEGNRLLQLQPIFAARPDKRGNAHYGARMALLRDGTIALGVGDGFIYREAAQQLDSHLGKIVRFARDGSIPRDNPFLQHDGALPEIFSSGHRNPQALVFDAVGETLYAHEHGPRGGDELNRIDAGRNYGWPLASFGVDYTGARITPFTEGPGLTAPLLYWTPSIAPAGMTLYRGALFPDWQGSLFVAALVERAVRRVSLRDGVPIEQEILFAELRERIRDVREGPDGALYLLTDGPDGKVLRITP